MIRIYASLEDNKLNEVFKETKNKYFFHKPETNLHPKKQLEFARNVAKLSNEGALVEITTHSDYIIQELNTLIMLNTKTERALKAQKRYDYKDEELLDYKSVQFFTISDIPEEAVITQERGIEAEIFDKVINKLNQIQQQIYY